MLFRPTHSKNSLFMFVCWKCSFWKINYHGELANSSNFKTKQNKTLV